MGTEDLCTEVGHLRLTIFFVKKANFVMFVNLRYVDKILELTWIGGAVFDLLFAMFS